MPFNCLQWLLTHVNIEKSTLIQDACSAKYLGLLREDWSGLRPCFLIQNPGLTLDWPSLCGKGHFPTLLHSCWCELKRVPHLRDYIPSYKHSMRNLGVGMLF